ncbi:hypothetical protein BDV25DRAFT_135706 [Aspergillus avenaceus]|uniref:Heterokaryon incompatibility protein-domain-containing protein n=1 Tax=Aspergillus avenaceus TaxID=36643 RepID=A0A5N6U7A9_ASPAV|nr:hypothetical protein BDV25DRAFT_135706 [Aspergillus avenaceus]
MRLICTKTPLELHEFAENELPKYAILSHRWEREEVSFRDMMSSDDKIKSKAGYRKIERFCARAHQDGLDYAWVDTCCINKESSTELSEAVNSMFRWYQLAEKCYAYLGDVQLENLQQSAWFQRGWTLQELLAPREVHFLASDWSDLGTRTSLCSLINEVTGIDNSMLLGRSRLEDFSIAKRMSWASGRQTTRSEDIAYCLMGIFNVNMPLLYGEGEKAFIRLQEQIMKDSDDQTLFAWENRDISEEHPSGLLARSPTNFRNSGDIVPYFFSKDGTPSILTNRGIRMHLPLIRVTQEKAVLILECHGGPGLVGISIMSRKDQSRSEGQWTRIGKAFSRDIPFRALSGAVLDTIYALKYSTGASTYPQTKQTKDDQKDQNAHQLVMTPLNYRVQPRGHHKKLIVCFDCAREKSKSDYLDTNISKIHRMFDRTEDNQVCYYYQGDLKTRPEVFAMNGYKFIMKHFERDDEIHLFGFSNGAHAALLLADLIEHFGVLATSHEDRAPKIWETYQTWSKLEKAPMKKPGQIKAKEMSFNNVKAFRESFCLPTGGVTFIGLFDTVNNQFSRKRRSPLTMSVPSHIIRHALAVDERRTTLQPILVKEMSNGDGYSQDIGEMWFPGTHHDIGSLKSTADEGVWSLSHIPLVWMVNEAMRAGLHFDRGRLLQFNCSDSFGSILPATEDNSPVNPHFEGALISASRKGVLHDALRYGCGYSALTVCKEKAKECLFSLISNGSGRLLSSKGSPREIPSGAAVHLSVLLRITADPNYRPLNIIGTRKELEADTIKWTSFDNGYNIVDGFFIRESSQGPPAQLGMGTHPP